MDDYKELLLKIEKAKTDTRYSDELIEKYMPFIKSETAKFMKRIPIEGQDDELSIAMFAFYEAIMSYNRLKGSFKAFSSRAIRNRLIDFVRKEARHTKNISIDEKGDDEDSMSILDTLEVSTNNVEKSISRNLAEEEIKEFSLVLSQYGLSLTDISDNCPKQDRTLTSCHKALDFAKKNTYIFDLLTTSKKLPITQISEGSGVPKKTLERHRKYVVAILLAFTNGFEIIRGHLSQLKR